MSQSKKRSRKAKQASSRNLKLWGGLALLAIVVVAIVGFILVNQATNSTSYPLTISPSETVAQQKSGAFILDVRTAAEWNDAHIAGATLIPLDQLPNRLNELPRDKVIVVVCHSGNRSAQGRDILLKAGFTQVTSMAGGMTQWQAQGYPTVSGQA